MGAHTHMSNYLNVISQANTLFIQICFHNDMENQVPFRIC